jgi:hypothetical protein
MVTGPSGAAGTSRCDRSQDFLIGHELRIGPAS